MRSAMMCMRRLTRHDQQCRIDIVDEQTTIDWWEIVMSSSVEQQGWADWPDIDEHCWSTEWWE